MQILLIFDFIGLSMQTPFNTTVCLFVYSTARVVMSAGLSVCMIKCKLNLKQGLGR